MKNKRINSILSIIMTTVIISLSFVTTANSMEKTESDNNIKIELYDKEVEELHNYWPEDKIFSDEKIDEILIKTGQFTQEELDKINQEVDDYAKKVNQNSRVKYINGYNKYRTFVKNLGRSCCSSYRKDNNN
ncbi:leucine-rich repeat protein [Clostridioides difficile]|nr:leucine-rich repeat protein [Clostridioides difficile]VIG67628.1 leucine-rich repeat protein [Clostridioides difficile]